eukprot:3966952-Amphidinium_carterae.1
MVKEQGPRKGLRVGCYAQLLLHALQDDANVFVLCEFLGGGDLFHVKRDQYGSSTRLSKAA